MYPAGAFSTSNRILIPAVAALCWCILPGAPATGAEAENADTLKAQTDRWIELEKRSADERNDWRTQKEILVTSIDVLKKERTSLLSTIEANDLAAGLFKVRLDNARTEFAAHETAQASLETNGAALEKRLRALFLRLPDPLKEKVGPLLQKMESAPDGAPPSVAEKTRALVSALTAIDLFNNTLTLTHHLRPNPPGETLDVKVLYWGLAVGYGIDAQGARAWMLTPGALGWEWKEASAHVREIRTLIAVYEKQQSPEVVALPLGSEGGAP